MTTPRIRTDLQAHPVEEDGLRFFDVTDPRAGTSMRLYEHEWLLARQMNGSTSLEDLARWAGEHVGFQPTPGDLGAYAKRLAELGFFDELAQIEAAAAGGAAATSPAADETSFASVANDAAQRPEVRAERKTPTGMELIEDDEAKPVPQRTSPPVMEATIEAEEPAPAERQDTVPSMPVIEASPSEQPAVAKPPVELPPVEPPRFEPPPFEQAVAQPPAVVIPPDQMIAEVKPRKSRGGLIAVLTLGGLGVAASIAYFAVIAPALTPVHVRVQPIAAPQEVFHYFEGKGTVSQPPPAELAFGTAGKLVDVVPVGTQTKPGMTLASLDTYAVLEKELADVRDRQTHYENQLKSAQAKNSQSEIARAKAKIEEKKALGAALEQKVAKARIVAPGVSTVAEVLVAAGGDVTPGSPVLRLGDKRTLATVKLPAAQAATIKPGQILEIAAGSAVGSAKVADIENDTVSLEITDDAGGAIKAGVEVQLVQFKLGKVLRVPAEAVSRSQGGTDRVFVLEGDVVHERKVTIVEKSGAEVLLKDGVQEGDKLVLSAAKELADGAKAMAE